MIFYRLHTDREKSQFVWGFFDVFPYKSVKRAFFMETEVSCKASDCNGSKVSPYRSPELRICMEVR